MIKNEVRRGARGYREFVRSVSLVTLIVAAGSVQAMPLDTGNPDLEIRWDNTIRYNLGMRMEGVSDAFARNPGTDETETKFGRHDIMLNRFDLLSEFDVVYMRDYGFRVSGAAWRDFAYDMKAHRNPALGNATAGAYEGDRFNGDSERYIIGPSGELLDAFVFGKIDIGERTLRVKAGRHNVFWGESLYTLGNSIAYSQGPVDSIKAATSPGAEAKELFMPLTQASGQIQVTDDISIAGQYLVEWKPFRLVPGGTYFSTSDQTRADYFVPGARIPWGSEIKPENRGDFGLNLRWNPNWLDGALGVYYRKFDEKIPWSITELSGRTPRSGRMVYARDTELYGLSLNRAFGPVSVGSEISYRHDTALNMRSGYAVQVGPGGATYEQAEGPRGNTLHFVLNGIWLAPKTSLWDGGTLQGEINAQHLLEVTKNASRFHYEGGTCVSAAGAPLTERDGCSTRNSVAAQVSFKPEWPQILPSVDLAMPIVVSYGIVGNSAALGGTNRGVYTWSVGLEANYAKRFDFGIKYVDQHTDYSTANGVFSTQNGSAAVQNNHGWLVATFKTTF